MKITKKNILSLVFVSFFILIQFIGIVGFSMEARAMQDLWEKQVGMGGQRSDGRVIGEAFGVDDPANPTDPREITVDIIKLFLTFVGIVMVAMIIFAGYKWMTAAGNDDKVKEAKDQMKNAIIGLIIILASYMILFFIQVAWYREIVN